MADKFDDIRNQIVDCADCPNVQIYENETVIFFQVTGQQLEVKQKGTITIQYKDGAVLFFENGVFLFSACNVENVRKANNDIYASTYLELVVALSAFLGFSSGGGGGIANVANGIYDDGGTAKLGGNLVEDTTILGSNIYSFIVAFLDNFIAQGAVLQLLATSLVDISSDDAINIIANGILQLTSANQINIDSSGAIRLTSNTNEVGINGNSLFYFGEENADGSFRIGITAGNFTIEKRIAGVWTTYSIPNQPVKVSKDEIVWCDTFIASGFTPNWLINTGAGGNVDLNQIGETGVVGIARFLIGVSTNSRYGIQAKIASLIRTWLDGNKMLYKTKVRPEALGAVGNSFIFNSGFLASTSVANPTIGLYFTYDRNNTQRVNPNALNWTIVSRVNNTDKVVLDTGAPVQIGVWTKLAIEFDTATNTANFYINTVLVGSILWNGLTGASSNLPMVGAATECTFGAILANTGTALGTAIRIDYMDFYKDFN
jgi:hypothetical protein